MSSLTWRTGDRQEKWSFTSDVPLRRNIRRNDHSPKFQFGANDPSSGTCLVPRESTNPSTRSLHDVMSLPRTPERVNSDAAAMPKFRFFMGIAMGWLESVADMK